MSRLGWLALVGLLFVGCGHPSTLRMQGSVAYAIGTSEAPSSVLAASSADNQARGRLSKLVARVVRDELRAFVVAHPELAPQDSLPPMGAPQLHAWSPSPVARIMSQHVVKSLAAGPTARSQAQVDLVVAAQTARAATSGLQRDFWAQMLAGTPPRIVVSARRALADGLDHAQSP